MVFPTFTKVLNEHLLYTRCWGHNINRTNNLFLTEEFTFLFLHLPQLKVSLHSL